MMKKNENRKRREDRKRTYSKMLNESRNVVGDELLFKTSNNFFKSSFEVFEMDWYRMFDDYFSSNYFGVHPVISLIPGAAITGGEGTRTEPFIVS